MIKTVDYDIKNQIKQKMDLNVASFLFMLEFYLKEKI